MKKKKKIKRKISGKSVKHVEKKSTSQKAINNLREEETLMH